MNVSIVLDRLRNSSRGDAYDYLEDMISKFERCRAALSELEDRSRRRAEHAEAQAKDTRFLSLADACKQDAKQYRQEQNIARAALAESE